MGKRSGRDDAGRKAGKDGLRVTRRGAIAVSAAAMAPAALLAQARGTVTTTQPQPELAQIEYSDGLGGAQKWTLDSRDFPGSRLAVDTERNVVSLTAARWPGTVLRDGLADRGIDFTVRVYRSEGVWRVSLRYDNLGEQAAAELPLLAWLKDGAPLVAPLRRVQQLVAGSVSRPLRIGIQPGGERRPTLSLFASNAWRLEGVLKLDAGGAATEIFEAGFLDLKVTRISPAPPVTRISAPTEAMRSEVLTLDAGEVQGAGVARITRKPLSALITAEEPGGQRSCVCTLHGEGGFLDLPDVTTTTPAFGVRLKTSTSVETRTGTRRTVVLEVSLSDAPVAIGLGPVMLRIAGLPEETVSVTFNGQTPASLTVPLHLAGLELPVKGASLAQIAFPTLRRLGTDLAGGAPGDAFLRLRPGGSGPRLTVELEGTRLQVQRYRDLLNLGFELRGFRLEGTGSAVSVKPGTTPSPHHLVAHFGPQHIAERAYYRQLNSRQRESDETPFQEVVEGRASAPSRLAFSVPPAERTRSWLDLAQLLNWDALSMSANWRAQPRAIDWTKVWSELGLQPDASRKTLLQVIDASLKEPAPHETALEMPYRMVLSPPENSKWETSTPADDPGAGSVIWHARLRPDRGGDSVRVLLARGVHNMFARVSAPVPDDTPWPPAGYDISVPPDARRELMALSSAYGIPALKRKQSGTTGQVELDPVFRFLTDQEGIYAPTPLQSAGMALTSLGGTLIARGQWEPPAPLTIADNWTKALSYERWIHRAMLGRDVFAEVVLKGFLFPLGHRASFVRQTERLFYPHPRTGEPTAYLIQRTFIEIANPSKPFPGVNQPFDGRMFPDVANVTLTTTRTPDLIDPRDTVPLVPGGLYNGSGQPLESNGALQLTTRDTPLAFWPRLTRKAGSEVRFEWTVNGGKALMTGPQMFVDNAVVHNPAWMKAVVEHYMGCGGWARDAVHLRRLRTAKYDGSAHRYAPAEEAGQTEFATKSWTFAVTGRRSKAGSLACLDPLLPKGVECEDFTVDSVMEGADQPPFYPMLESAKMRVQSLDRLTDRPGHLLTAAPNFAFIEGGFDPARNPGELFLDILDPQPSLDFGGVGDRAGGVAQPNLKVVALSRKSGPVGGKSSLRPPPARLTTFLDGSPLGYAERAPSPSSAAQSGKFDPFEFFGDAKLLGAVPLKEVVKAAALSAAPKLVETAQYGAGQAFSATAAAVRKVALPLGKLLDTVETQLKGAAVVLGLSEAEWTELYPKLAKALKSARKALAAAEQAANGSDLAKLITATTEAVRDFSTFADRLAEAISNPVPTFVKEAIAKLTSAWARLANLSDLSRKLADAFKAQLLWPQSVSDALCVNGKPTPFAVVYFGLPEDVCVSPADLAAAVERLQMGLLHETFGQSLVELQGAIGDLVVARRAEIGARVTGLVARGLEFAVNSAAMAQAAKISATYTDTWTRMSAAHKALTDSIMAAETDLLRQAAALEADLAELRPEISSAELRAALVARRAAALGATQQFRTTLATVQVLRKTIADGDIATMKMAGLQIVTRLYRLRAEALGQLRDLIGQAMELADILAAAGISGDAALRDARQRLDRIVTSATGLLQGVSSVSKMAPAAAPATLKAWLEPVVKPWRDARANQAASVDAAVLELGREAAALKGNLDVARSDLSAAIAAAKPAPRELGVLAVDTVTYAIRQDRRLAGLIAGGSQLAGTLEATLTDWAFQALLRTATAGRDIEDTVYNALTGLLAILETGPVAPALQLLLRPELIVALRTSYADLNTERKALDWIVTNLASDATRGVALTTADQLRTGWRQKPPALVEVLNAAQALADALLSGQLGKLPDLRTAEQELREHLRRFVPARVKLNYDWQTDLGKFPSSGRPIFEMAAASEGGVKDLTLSTEVSIDLLSGARKFTGTGKLQPFRINLLGDFDLVSINFAAARFTTSSSGVKLDAKVDSVTIGKDLKFIQALQSYMSGGGATGPYWAFNPPVLEVGYRFALDLINLGALQFINIALSVSAELPLTSRDARFRFSFASPDRPFLIASPPYGGGGFVALVANATGIIGFEASFEFGAVTALKFGPLNAQGRVTAGLYLSQSQEKGAVIAGFVRAVGEGSIACFSVSVFIEVRMQQNLDTGAMVGTSTYRLSFKVGFAEISYQFTAVYNVRGGGGPSRLARHGSHAALAANDTDPWDQDMCRDVGLPMQPIIVKAPLKTSKWGQYRKRFSADLLSA